MVAADSSSQPGYPLTVTIGGAGEGTVTSIPTGIRCPGTCTIEFPRDSLVRIEAEASSGSTVDSWNGCDQLIEENCLVIMTGEKAVTATFTIGHSARPPYITKQPVDQTVNSRDPAIFRVVAAGTPTPTYQWRRDGIPIPGATKATYTLVSTTPADSGAQFDVVVTNTEGMVTSGLATLMVLNEPILAWEAAAQTAEGSWADSSWTNRSFRILLEGAHITTSGRTVQLTLRGRTSEAYRVQRVSLVRREGQTLNGVDGTRREVTFGGTWNAGVTVPAGGPLRVIPSRLSWWLGKMCL